MESFSLKISLEYITFLKELLKYRLTFARNRLCDTRVLFYKSLTKIYLHVFEPTKIGNYADNFDNVCLLICNITLSTRKLG